MSLSNKWKKKYLCMIDKIESDNAAHNLEVRKKYSALGIEYKKSYYFEKNDDFVYKIELSSLMGDKVVEFINRSCIKPFTPEHYSVYFNGGIVFDGFEKRKANEIIAEYLARIKVSAGHKIRPAAFSGVEIISDRLGNPVCFSRKKDVSEEQVKINLENRIINEIKSPSPTENNDDSFLSFVSEISTDVLNRRFYNLCGIPLVVDYKDNIVSSISFDGNTIYSNNIQGDSNVK